MISTQQSLPETTDYMKDFVKNYEQKEKEKKKKVTSPRGLEVFYKEK